MKGFGLVGIQCKGLLRMPDFADLDHVFAEVYFRPNDSDVFWFVSLSEKD